MNSSLCGPSPPAPWLAWPHSTAAISCSGWKNSFLKKKYFKMTKFKDKLSSSPDTSYLPSHSTSPPLSYLHKVGSAMSCNSNRSARLAMIAGGDDSNFLVSRTCVRSCGSHVGWRCGLQDEVELVPAHVHLLVVVCWMSLGTSSLAMSALSFSSPAIRLVQYTVTCPPSGLQRCVRYW